MPMYTNRFATLVAHKELEIGRRLSQKEMAQYAEVSEATISRWINNKDIEKMTLATVWKLCRWLACDIEDLIQIHAEERTVT
jgi:DNA-binding Xre family transcriptional regulator